MNIDHPSNLYCARQTGRCNHFLHGKTGVCVLERPDWDSERNGTGSNSSVLPSFNCRHRYLLTITVFSLTLRSRTEKLLH